MLRLTPIDAVWVRVDCDDAIARELSDYFTFEAPGARFMKRQMRFKGWDGRVRLFKLKTRTIYRGLVPRILEFAEQREYPVENRTPPVDPLWKDLNEYFDSADLKYEVRDYQHAALRVMLDEERKVILSPTGSGKSYIIHLIAQLLGDENVLIIVPTLGLVTQMVNDLRDYGCDEDIQTIQGGTSKVGKARIVVSTWQSIHGLDADAFDRYGCVIVDEVHLAKGKSLTGLLEKCSQANFRYGFTGTLDQTEVHRLVLEGLFGSVTRVASTDQLVKSGHLTKPRVIVCVLEYPEMLRKQLRHADYQQEIEYLVSNGARNKFLALLCRETTGPTLALFQLVKKHGQTLLGLSKKTGGKNVLYIDGQTSAEDRETIRQTMNGDDLLLASYGTMQLGVNIPKLQNLVFAHPSKSVIRVLQSIGRVLRLSSGKEQATIIDVVDDLRIGKHVNHAFRHAAQRMDYYAAEKFPVTMKNIPIEMFAHMGAPAAPTAPETTNAGAGEELDLD